MSHDMVPVDPDAASAAGALQQVADGHALSWHGPGWGTFLSGVRHVFATREVVAVPAADALDAGARTPAEFMHAAARTMLANAAAMPGCDAFEIRYVSSPEGNGPARIRMYLTAKTRDRLAGVAETAVQSACAALPVGYTSRPAVDGLGLGALTESNEAVVELRRDEETTQPQWTFIPAEFYYVVHGEPGDGSGWPAFWRALTVAPDPVTVSILFQQTELDGEERWVLGSLLSDLGLLAEPHSESDFFGNQEFYPACANARLAHESWEERLSRLNRPLLARIAVRSSVETAVQVAGALATATAVAADGRAVNPMYVEAPQAPADARQAAFGLDWLEILPWGGHPVWAEETAPHRLRRLPYLYGLDAAAGLAVLPVPDADGAPGFPRSRRLELRRAQVAVREAPADGVRLGRFLHHGRPAGACVLPLAAVNRHVLVVGSSGSGKTSTVFRLLTELWTQHSIPFLCIEPVKQEYRNLLAAPGMAELAVYTLGREDVSPLRLNPLEPPPGVRCESHVSAVMAALKTALALFDPLPALLAKALDLTYAEAGWDDDTTVDDGLQPPTLRDLLAAFDRVFVQARYQGEAANIAAAGRVRLESLLRGSLGRMLDTVRSTDLAGLMSRPTVIELDEISDNDDKAVVAALLLDRIRAAAKHRRPSAGALRHVTVLEEAHRLLGSSRPASQADGVDPRGRAVEAFAEAIAELRSLGEGFVLSSQRPGELSASAVANAGTRVLHRLETAEDRRSVLDDADVDEQGRQAAARLQAGEAVVRWADEDEAHLVLVDEPAVSTAAAIGTDTVAEHVAAHRRATLAVMPFRMCSTSICPGGCSRPVRSVGRRMALSLEAGARQRWSDADRPWAVAPEIVATLLRQADDDVRAAYCGAAHLEAGGAAFGAQSGVAGQRVEGLLRSGGHEGW